MRPAFYLILRYMLTVALLTGSVATWSSDMVHGPVASDSAPAPAAATHGSDSTDCDFPQDKAGDPANTDADYKRCCAEQDECQHENCDSACLALSLVVPPHLPASGHLPTRIRLSMLIPGAPRNTTDTPLRPPKA